MSLHVPSLLFVAGLSMLLYGASRAVRAAGKLARFYGISALFVGVAVISIGTSLPEMATAIIAGLEGQADFLVGNVVGSETSQITLAAGIVALIAPIAAKRRSIIVYGGAMLTAMSMMLIVLLDGTITVVEAGLMMLAYGFFLYHLFTEEGGDEILDHGLAGDKPPRYALPWIGVGIGLVFIGAHLMVSNASLIATDLGVPTYIIGLLTGLGTTLPEIAVAGTAAYRGKQGISAGSLLGSNITDPVLSLPLGVLAGGGLTLAEPGIAIASAGYMLAVSIIVLGLFYWRGTIDRSLAIVCILLYLPSFLVL